MSRQFVHEMASLSMARLSKSSSMHEMASSGGGRNTPFPVDAPCRLGKAWTLRGQEARGFCDGAPVQGWLGGAI
eukprot:3859072-Prorocentrum_lima.AAC.1